MYEEQLKETVSILKKTFTKELCEIESGQNLIRRYAANCDAAEAEVQEIKDKIYVLEGSMQKAMGELDDDKVDTFKKQILTERKKLEVAKLSLQSFNPKVISETRERLSRLRDELSSGFVDVFREQHTEPMQQKIINLASEILGTSIELKEIYGAVCQEMYSEYGVQPSPVAIRFLNYPIRLSVIFEQLIRDSLAIKWHKQRKANAKAEVPVPLTPEQKGSTLISVVA